MKFQDEGAPEEGGAQPEEGGGEAPAEEPKPEEGGGESAPEGGE